MPKQNETSVDRRRLLFIFGIGLFLISVVLAAVLGTILPESRKRAEASAAAAAAANADKCGPLCPVVPEAEEQEGSTTSRLPPEPDRLVFDKTCLEWHMESLNRIKLQATTEKKGVDNDATATCQDVFGAAAYACGCAGTDPVEPPADGTCGSVSQSPSAAYMYFFHSYNIEIVRYLSGYAFQ